MRPEKPSPVFKTASLLALLLVAASFVSCEETKMAPLKPKPPEKLCEGVDDCEGAGGDTFIRVPLIGCYDTLEVIDNFSGSASAVVETADGYIVIGSKVTRESGSSVLALKIDRTGAMLWQKSLSNVAFMNMAIPAVESDGGAVVAMGDLSGAEEDILVVKIDAAGSIAWQILIGAETRDYAWGIDKALDGSILVTGSSSSIEETRTFVAKIAPDGTLLWQKIIRSMIPGFTSIYGDGVAGTRDGGAVVTGALYETTDPVAVLKLDADGNLLWQQTFAGGAHGPAGVEEGADGSLAVICGAYRDTPDGPYLGMLIMRLAPDGALEWQKLIAPPAAQFQLSPMDILATRDGGLVVLAGGADPDPTTFDWGWKSMVFKFDRDGRPLWQKVYSVGGNEQRVIGVGAYDILETSDGRLLSVGEISLIGMDSSELCFGMLLLRTDSLGEIAPNCPFVEAGSFPMEDRHIPPTSLMTEVLDAGMAARGASLTSRDGPIGGIQPICGVSDLAWPL